MLYVTTDLPISNVPTAALRTYVRNSRTHSPKQTAQIAAGIQASASTQREVLDV